LKGQEIAMNIPFNFGLPQIILILVGLVGLWLFITAAQGLLRRSKDMDRDEFERYKKTGRLPWRRFRFRRGISGIVLIFLAASLLWATFLVQTYLGLTANIKVAQVRAVAATNVPHEMSVELILYDTNGHQLSDHTYVLKGDEWMLQADFIKFPTWLNIIGFHSGYKLTRLEGLYQDPSLESNSRHTVVELNGGEDGFFTTMRSQQFWFSPFVDAYFGNAAFELANGTYDVFASQDGLYAKSTG
jgi:hypothetical protein